MPGEILAYTLAGRSIEEKDLPAVLDNVFRERTYRYCPAPGSEDDRICSTLVERGYLFRDEMTADTDEPSCGTIKATGEGIALHVNFQGY